ncbi:hypothetical protein ACFWB0_06225 [Rhodococcus sp. NPDC060086]|uniref:hypothetical protein n=1 Tax=Rhodococcus sp. NPDC060086 TaxID=3347055 RepID=UPI00364BBFD8
MSYSALVLQILVSSPSDLPPEHRTAIEKSIKAWNITYGKMYSINFVTTDWKVGGSPAFGEYGQSVLNEQIVDDSDIGLVIFTDRLGTPTPDHQSGTDEEIKRLLDQGKEVAVLKNNCNRQALSGTEALQEKLRLEQYLEEEIFKRAFVSSYDSLEGLRDVLALMLPRLALKYKHDSEPEPERSVQSGSQAGDLTAPLPESEASGIWPRIEVQSYQETDSKGRLKNKKNWYLVLQSDLPYAARNVRFEYQDSEGNLVKDFDIMAGRNDPIEILAPRGEERFPVFVTFGSTPSAICVVNWEDTNGVEHTTRASVRTK